MADRFESQGDLDAALERLRAANQLSAPDALGLAADILDYAVGESVQTYDNGAHLFRVISEGFRDAATDASPDAKSALKALGDFWSGVADDRDAVAQAPRVSEAESMTWSTEVAQVERTQVRFRDTSQQWSWSFDSEQVRGAEHRPASSDDPMLTQAEFRKRSGR